MNRAPEDAALFTKALGNIARTRGVLQLARDSGITREGLYKALGEQDKPSFANVIKVMHALGLQFNMGLVRGRFGCKIVRSYRWHAS